MNTRKPTLAWPTVATPEGTVGLYGNLEILNKNESVSGLSPRVMRSLQYDHWNTPLQLYYTCLTDSDSLGAIDSALIKDTVIGNYKDDEVRHSFTDLITARSIFNCYLNKGDVFLDLGCSIGHMLILAMDYGARETYGVELSPLRVKFGKSVLENPEMILGSRDTDGIFKYLDIDKRVLPREVVEGFNKCLEKACEQLKPIKDKIHIREGDILESTPELKKADLVFINVSSLFNEGVYVSDWNERKRIEKIRMERKEVLQRKLSEARQSKIVTVGLELPKRELIDKSELTSPSLFGTSSTLIRVYEKG